MIGSYLDDGIIIDFVWKTYFPTLYSNRLTLMVLVYAFYSAGFSNVDVT